MVMLSYTPPALPGHPLIVLAGVAVVAVAVHEWREVTAHPPFSTPA